MLSQHMVNGKLRHAYLFSGPTGVGRRTLALRFAQAVNCEVPPAAGEACGECRSCRQILQMQHTDLAVVQSEDGGVLKVEQVRDLQHFVSLAPYASNYRVALLLDFEQANDNAQNALLKTLEEPNPKVLLLVTVDDAENLLPTITSRCELIRLRPMQIVDLSALLQEKAKLDAEKAGLIAHLAGGRVGYALRMAADEVMSGDRKIWMDDLLALVPAGKNFRIQYARKHTNARHADRTDAKKRLSEGMAHWLSFWRDVMLACVESQTELTNVDLKREIHHIAKAVEPSDAENAVRTLEHAFIRLQTANLQLMLDNILLGWPRVQFQSE